jgi:uncharacterized protein YhaN
LAALPLDRALSELVERFTAAQQADTRRQELLKQQQQQQARLAETQTALDRCQAELEVLCQEAGCAQADDLPEVERRSRQRRVVQSELDGVGAQLLDLAEGQPLEEMLGEAEACDLAQLKTQIGELGPALEALQHERDQLHTTIGSQRSELARMDGSAAAAEAEAEAAALVARIQADARQYVRLRLAASVLRDTIDRFRQENQGPVLCRASELFAALTLGSFAELRIDSTDKGESTLVGVRDDKTVVHLDGMSDGTADQLYLALRLASLERYFHEHPPVPFVVDDILIKFDDRRAAAALRALGELARRTQVIVFTHHRHLLELAAADLPPQAFAVVRLDSRQAA